MWAAQGKREKDSGSNNKGGRIGPLLLLLIQVSSPLLIALLLSTLLLVLRVSFPAMASHVWWRRVCRVTGLEVDRTQLA